MTLWETLIVAPILFVVYGVVIGWWAVILYVGVALPIYRELTRPKGGRK